MAFPLSTEGALRATLLPAIDNRTPASDTGQRGNPQLAHGPGLQGLSQCCPTYGEMGTTLCTTEMNTGRKADLVNHVAFTLTPPCTVLPTARVYSDSQEPFSPENQHPCDLIMSRRSPDGQLRRSHSQDLGRPLLSAPMSLPSFKIICETGVVLRSPGQAQSLLTEKVTPGSEPPPVLAPMVWEAPAASALRGHPWLVLTPWLHDPRSISVASQL